MSFITDFVGELTGANAMKDATQIQRDQYGWMKDIATEDRTALKEIYDQAVEQGFFDHRARQKMWREAAAPGNARDLANVGAAEKALGARPGDTNAQAAIAMVLDKQKQEEADRALGFFEQAFKDRFTMRHAIGGGDPGAALSTGQTLSGTLMGQGQQQQQGFMNLVSAGMAFAKPGGKKGGATAGGNPTGFGGDGSTESPFGSVPTPVMPSGPVGSAQVRTATEGPAYADNDLIQRARSWAAA